MSEEIKIAQLVFPHFNGDLSWLAVKQRLLNQATRWERQLVRALVESGILFCGYDELTRNEKRWLREYFDEQIFPVLTTHDPRLRPSYSRNRSRHCTRPINPTD